MDTAAIIDETNKQSFFSILLKPLVNLWNRVINIGITVDTLDFDKKRTRLINGVCLWSFVTYVGYIAYFANVKEARFVFYESFAGLFASIFPVVINYYRKYDLSCHLFLIYNSLFYLFMSVAEGGRDAVEYIFVPVCVMPMLLFKAPRVIISYFVADVIFFCIGKISHQLMHPLFVYDGQQYQRPANYLTMFIFLFLIVYYFRSENTRQEDLLEKRNNSLSVEKKKSDDLLTNILPHETAEELKHTGTAQSRSFKMVTVMFTDFRNFTMTAEALHPERLVSEIHHYFSIFDAVMSKYNIEKIKTIGDSYMCAGGLPEQNSTNPVDVVSAALEIQQFMLNMKKEKQEANELFFECRLGIHTGPVIAGIVGTKKFAYDIWGDTVNVASRMESSGEVGKVNISGTTYNLVKDHFKCEYRGKVQAKNKGMVDMYFVDGLIDEV